jgi:hypothetical protein
MLEMRQGRVIDTLRHRRTVSTAPSLPRCRVEPYDHLPRGRGEHEARDTYKSADVIPKRSWCWPANAQHTFRIQDSTVT